MWNRCDLAGSNQNESWGLRFNLQDYSGWLKDRVASDSYWAKISSCIRDSKVCRKMGVTVNGIPETANMFYLRRLTPIEVSHSPRSLLIEAWPNDSHGKKMMLHRFRLLGRLVVLYQAASPDPGNSFWFTRPLNRPCFFGFQEWVGLDWIQDHASPFGD